VQQLQPRHVLARVLLRQQLERSRALLLQQQLGQPPVLLQAKWQQQQQARLELQQQVRRGLRQQELLVLHRSPQL
jgi:hypothetical protein